jgi:hypothetical protein
MVLFTQIRLIRSIFIWAFYRFSQSLSRFCLRQQQQLTQQPPPHCVQSDPQSHFNYRFAPAAAAGITCIIIISSDDDGDDGDGDARLFRSTWA